MITIGCHPNDFSKVCDIARAHYPIVAATLGVHPHEAKFLDDAVENTIRAESKNDFIIWTSSRKLMRKDFEGTKPDSSNASAGASIRLRLNYVIKGMSTSFDARCLFFKKESWYVYSDTRRLILLHEQGHFDIGEIVARKLRKDLSESVKKTP